MEKRWMHPRVFAIIVFILATMVFAGPALADDLIPVQFAGTVTLNGSPADGSLVEAKIGGIVVDSYVAQMSGGEAWYSLTFSATPGTMISFWVDGYFATQTDTWASGLNMLNLTATSPTAVELASFEAMPLAGGVELIWVTGAEVGNLGFNLYRVAQGEKTKLNSALIPTTSVGDMGGAAYRFLDESALPGVMYDYWLEDVDCQGATTLHGPVSAMVLAAQFEQLVNNPVGRLDMGPAQLDLAQLGRH